MKTLKYTVIKSNQQYNDYCNILEKLVLLEDDKYESEIELLRLLVEKWDNENNSMSDLNPVELIKALMVENNLRAKDLAEIVGLSKGTISKILNYHKGLSKESIRKLANHFHISQSSFNRPYKLIHKVNRHFRDASLMNTEKDLLT